jgi:glycosyltransferase involved in cell wall biosynthesis
MDTSFLKMSDSKKSILFVINDFNVGGAELFVLRLGIALQSNFSIYILDIYPSKSNIEFKKRFLNNGFILLNRFQDLPKWKENLYWKINAIYSLFGKQGKFSELKKSYQDHQLKKSIKANKIQIIHSHYFSSDCFVRNFLLTEKLKWVLTMHGDYNRSVYEKMVNGKESFLESLISNIKKVDFLAHVANVNLDILEDFNIIPKSVKKISLGLNIDKGITHDLPSDQKEQEFTFCMVARSNPDKGWQLMVDAFIELNIKYPSTKLICVGPIEGVVKELATIHFNNSAIIFTGYTDSPTNFIQESDICVLPTYFEGESSPYSVIEYLAYQKPVIATNKGEIKEMLDANGKCAGSILELTDDGKPNVNDLTKAMETLMLDTDLYEEKLGLTSIAFEKFTMQKCKEEYLKIYEKLLN